MSTTGDYVRLMKLVGFMQIRKIPLKYQSYLKGDTTPAVEEERPEDPQVSNYLGIMRKTLLTDRGLHDQVPSIYMTDYLPSLPSTPKSATINSSFKPLPPSPSSHSFDESSQTLSKKLGSSPHVKQRDYSPSKLSYGSSQLNHGHESSSGRSHGSHRKVKKRKTSHSLKPPELQSTPQLLPLFVEMVRQLSSTICAR